MLLITGAEGQLGHCLKDALGDAPAIYAGQAELDITDEAAVARFFKENKVDWVVNCAAYTNVDKAEDEPDAALKLNADAVGFLAKYGKKIIHISTDYVFDGTAHLPYIETDATNPLSAYGKSKAAGERAVLENAETAVIVRSAWLYSGYGNNFVKTMQKLGAERAELDVVFDQIGTPTFGGDLAEAIVKILPLAEAGTKEIYNFSNEGVCSWYDLAHKVMELSNLDCAVRPIETKDYHQKAKRPPYSVLNKAKIKRKFGIEISHWEDALRRCIK